MHSKLPKPLAKAIIYEDAFLYVCLATHPIAPGHTVVVWKENVSDLRRLTDRDYDFLMDTVRAAREAMLKALHVGKVYLIYMDEAKHVHWHLVPRYNEKGYNVFLHQPKRITDFSLAEKIKHEMKFK